MIKMRILVATNVGGLDDNVSMVFARAPTFTIIDTDGKEIKNVDVMPNQFTNAVHGAGVQVGQYIISLGINVAIAGNFGPNVSSILSQAGIQTISAQGRVRDVVERLLKGELSSLPPSPSSFPPPPPLPPASMPPAMPEPNINVDEKIKDIEERINRIEGLIDEIKRAIKEMKEE